MKQKFDKFEKKQIRRDNIAAAMAGSGIYIYQNSSQQSELTLPRPTRSGVRKVAPSGQFQGDDYYMQLVRTGFLRLVEVLQTAEQEKESQMIEDQKEEQKLLLEQPDQVTDHGTVEHVVAKPGVKNLNETAAKGKKPSTELLLNEGSSDDGFVIVG